MQKRLLFLISLLLCLTTTMMAQITTSGMSGRVTADGEEVIGATIEAVHVPSGTKYHAVTNAKGMFTISGMRPGGPYHVKVSYIGYQTKEFTDVNLSLGESYNLPVWLEADTKELGEVVITGQAGVNNTRNGAAESINNARIQELPSINHSVADIARINPFVKVTEGGAMYFAGSNNRYNAIMIDGAMSNDVFGLTQNGANGGQAGTQAFSMETIDQLQRYLKQHPSEFFGILMQTDKLTIRKEIRFMKQFQPVKGLHSLFEGNIHLRKKVSSADGTYRLSKICANGCS